MIPLEWVRMFGSSELQLLISGDQRRIDIAGTFFDHTFLLVFALYLRIVLWQFFRGRTRRFQFEEPTS